MIAEFRAALDRVGRRFRHARLWGTLAVCWLAWAILGLGLSALLDRSLTLPLPGPWLLAAYASLAAATGLVGATLALRTARDRRWVARRIEARHPELAAGLLAAVEQDAAAPLGPLGFLQVAVIRQVLDHRRTHDWDQAVPTWTLRGSKLAHWSALGLLLFASFGLAGQSRSNDVRRASALALANAADLMVEPGDAAIERGNSLLVVARFGKGVPVEADLVIEGIEAAGSRRPMTRSLEDPTFAGRVESVEADFAYRVEFAGQTSESYRITVFEYPEVLRADAHLAYPVYTGLPSKTVEDIRHVTAVEGTVLTLFCRLNKEVASARLVDPNAPGATLALEPTQGDPQLYRATFPLADSRRFRVQLVDREGRPNKLPAEIAVNVTRNKPATVKVLRPAHDVRVSPVEELALQAQLDDDFGLIRHGVTVTRAGQEPKEVVLGTSGPQSKALKADHLIDFESLNVDPDQLVMYHFWAEDHGPDGRTRRSDGDMFFAEVRPFEEIFRQGEQPPSGESQQQQGQQNGAAEQAMELADLQKEIINGTWTLIRREAGAKPTATFADDARVLLDAQRSAIEKAGPLAEKLEDPASKASLDQATKFMEEAARQLARAADAPEVGALQPALVAEQSAYQALLKLRDREFNVVRGNSRQRQGGRSAGGPSQRQLQQLELTNEQNRYEEQRSAREQAQSQREQAQAEDRQVLNRLRELARRQADLNERLKELQAALEAAEDQEAREEIERQLKRLRDQQQQVLRDTDELQERMESEPNRDRMADARQQVEQGREHVRQASEALENGQLAEALTEGTRAGRQLEDLREELRRQTSDRFDEDLTAMRDQARHLDETQEALTEKLEAKDDPDQARPSLRQDDRRQEIQAGLEDQEEQLDRLLETMRQTVQDAEETEPLLAKGLFDAIRQAQEQRIPDALKAAEQLAELGIADEAARASKHAGKGLDQLREGVERAAESVLGDETAALRRARAELDDLAEQVGREIALASGDEPTNPGEGPRDGQADPDQRRRSPGLRSAQDPNGEPPEEQDPGQAAGQPGRGQPPQDPQSGQSGQREQQQGQQGQGQQGQGQQGQQGQGQQQGQQGQQGQGQPGQGGQQGGGGRRAGLDQLADTLGQGGPGGPITGEGFRQWSDRMRDVEELLDDPELRSEAARIRDRVRGAREEFRRHSKEPDWTQLQSLVAEPIRELRDRVAEEVRRRESPDSLVPIDRDPVPPQFAEGVRRYYERLGSGR